MKKILNDESQIMFLTLKEYKYLLKCQTLSELIYKNCTPKEIKEFIESKVIKERKING